MQGARPGLEGCVIPPDFIEQLGCDLFQIT
jgi:hypothetical protein